MDYCSTFAASNKKESISKVINNVLHIVLVVVLLIVG